MDADRTTCAEIRGTEYRSQAERDFYLSECVVSKNSALGTLARIKHCESGGNYYAVDKHHAHFGAYQFDMQTWVSVGGDPSVRPDQAMPSEQDYRAYLLYLQRGNSPWPNC